MFGKRIAELRKRHGLTQAELAKSIGISRSALSLYETEKREPDIETLSKFTSLFKVSTDYLLGNDTLSDTISKPEEQIGDYMTLAKRLKELRLENGLTQLQLAEILDISKSDISKYETGIVEPNSDIVTKIATYFGVFTDYLLGVSDNRIKESDLEWRYSHVQNRLGSILFKYRKREQLSIDKFAEKIGISKTLEAKLEQGIYVPTMPLIKKIANITGYDVDYLTGATNSTHVLLDSASEIGTEKIPIYLSESDAHFRSRFEELCIRNNINKENASDTLHITSEDFFDICWNRMPTLSELLRIAYTFNVSLDYLIGKTDTPFSSLSKDELELVLNYRDCIEPYKQNIRERTEKLSVESAKVSSVAADEPLKRTGTDCLGK